jgi:hypothetical protein
MYEGLSLQVIWIYLKRIRYMKHGFTMITKENVLKDVEMSIDLLFGKEDVVAKGTLAILNGRQPNADMSLVRDMFRKENIARVMHYASFNEALLAKSNWGIVTILNLDDDGLQHWHEEEELVLGAQGKSYLLFSTHLAN